MLSIILPVPILGFVIFLMIDSGKRFEDLKKEAPEQAKDYERQYALLMTLLVVLAIILVAASMYAYYERYHKTKSVELVTLPSLVRKPTVGWTESVVEAQEGASNLF